MTAREQRAADKAAWQADAIAHHDRAALEHAYRSGVADACAREFALGDRFTDQGLQAEYVRGFNTARGGK